MLIFTNLNFNTFVFLQVFYNRDPDRENALEKIDKVQHDLDGIFNIEFVTIALPDGRSHFHKNPNPGAISILTSTTNQNTRPYLAPYLIHWNANNIPVYYIVSWNHHIVLRCGVMLYFNIILDIISRPQSLENDKLILIVISCTMKWHIINSLNLFCINNIG